MEIRRLAGEAVKSYAFGSSLLLAAAISVFCVLQEISSRPGYESSLILSPALSLLGGISTISLVMSRKKRGLSAFPDVILASIILLLLPFLILTAGAAARGSCDLADGIGFFIVGPIFSTAAATTGCLVISMVLRGRAAAYFLWACIWAGSIAASFLSFYFTPKVNIYDHLLGYFAGPLWDEAVKVDGRLIVFRGITAARLAAILYVFFSGAQWEKAEFSRRKFLKSKHGCISAALLAAVFAVSYHVQLQVGISTTRKIIESRLSRIVRSPGATLFLPPGVRGKEALLLQREVMFRQWQLLKFFGEKPPEAVRLYFFNSASEMKKLTGTGPTSLAKPWLGEAYMVYHIPPHPALKHELAHIHAALWGTGPLRLPGKLWGLLSDPVLLEGTAVAADWDSDPATPHQVFAASVEVGILKKWDPFSSTGFFSTSRGLSYEASGSFVRFVRDAWGKEALRRWYGGVPFEKATGVRKLEAVGRWNEFAAGIQLPPGLALEMKRIHSTPSIFRRKCPHAVANLYDEINACISSGEVERAAHLFGEIEALDPDSSLHRLRKIELLASTCAAKVSDLKALLEDRYLEKTQPLMVYSLCGDIAWRAGDGGRAEYCYGKALEHAFDDYQRRLLGIKRWAVGMGGELATLYREYLVCKKGEFPPGELARVAHLLSIIDSYPHIAVTYYLLGRVMMNAGQYEAAAAYLEKSLKLHDMNSIGPLPRSEVQLLLAYSCLQLGAQTAKAEEILKNLEKEGKLSPGESSRLEEMKQYTEFLIKD